MDNVHLTTITQTKKSTFPLNGPSSDNDQRELRIDVEARAESFRSWQFCSSRKKTQVAAKSASFTKESACFISVRFKDMVQDRGFMSLSRSSSAPVMVPATNIAKAEAFVNRENYAFLHPGVNTRFFRKNTDGFILKAKQ